MFGKGKKAARELKALAAQAEREAAACTVDPEPLTFPVVAEGLPQAGLYDDIGFISDPEEGYPRTTHVVVTIRDEEQGAATLCGENYEHLLPADWDATIARLCQDCFTRLALIVHRAPEWEPVRALASREAQEAERAQAPA